MKVFIVAGGTGGHLYPGIALACALSGHEIIFVVRRGDLGRDILAKEGFAVREIAGQGLPRAVSFKLLTFPFQFMRGWLEAWRLLQNERPDRVVGMGGYLSFPVILIARIRGIKTLLHEQNVLPGLTNRLLGRWADSVAVSFPASTAHFKGAQTWVSGLPIRPEVGSVDKAAARNTLHLDATRPTFLVFGGSLGARQLNLLVLEAWVLLAKENFQFQALHVTGRLEYDRIAPRYQTLNLPVQVMPYCHRMPEAYAASDAILCRSGASTVAELLAVQRPALLVPYPYASDNHQVDNAWVLVDAGLGTMVLEKDLTPATIVDFFKKAMTDAASKHAFESAAHTHAAELHPKDAASRLSARVTAV